MSGKYFVGMRETQPCVARLQVYHLEHHLFPAVPTIKLLQVARRIDEALPEMDKKNTF